MEGLGTLSSTIKLFFPKYHIEKWDKLFIDKENKKITLPGNIWWLTDEEVLWFILLIFEKKDIEEKKENINLSKLEKDQLEKIFSYIKTYHNTETSFMFDKKSKIKLFLNKLAKNINAKWPLWEFIKDELTFLDINCKNINEFVEKYLDYKWQYLETKKTKSDEQEGNNIEDEKWYYEHDGVNMEQMEWEDLWVIWYLDPEINKTYFVRWVLEKWNKETWQFNQVQTEKEKQEQEAFSPVLTTYFWQGRKWKLYVLSLSKDLKPVSWDEEKIEIFKDAYWRYLFKLKQDWKFEINIWYRKEQEQFFDTDSVDEIIYTWNNIDLSNFSDWKELKDFIRNKKYSTEVSQKWFKRWNNWNSYVENLFNAESMDCLPANVLFTILARSLWYKTRFVLGFSTYKKDWKTYVSKNQGHAWSEIYLDWRWERIDATPINTDEEQNEEGDIENQIEQIMEWEWIKKEIDNLEIKHTSHELKKVLDLPNIESIYFKSAVEYVHKDAEQIVSYINHILKKRKEILNKQKIKWIPKKNKRWLSSWTLSLNTNIIEKLAVWDPNIFERKRKMIPKLDEDIDTLLKDISIAIDVSWSMWSLTWNWENWSKLDNAYLSVVLLYLVTKKLWINFSKVITFSDEVWEFTPEEILEKMEFLWKGWNTQNTNGIKQAIESIKNTQKWVVFVISDGDGETWQEFFNERSKKLLEENTNLFTVWYGIWEDASNKLLKHAKHWKIPTVIEYRMDEAKHKRSKWYPVENYSNLVEKLKEDLTKFMTQKDIML